ELFGVNRLPESNFPPRYNIAPTQPIPIVRLDHAARHFALVRWGLIPSWVQDPKDFALLFNARLEGIESKPVYRAAMRRRRCLIPADGFYEWKKEGKGRRPYFVRARDKQPFAFAGLWETWSDRDGGEIETAAIIICEANETLAPIHDRMPVIVPREKYDPWLDADRIDARPATALVGPAPDDFLEAYEISTRVNKADNDGAENLLPVVREPSPD
ncbi:MAG: SOS response-associated peptidase, partial [Xanthobacteraceae bacterium]